MGKFVFLELFLLAGSQDGDGQDPSGFGLVVAVDLSPRELDIMSSSGCA